MIIYGVNCREKKGRKKSRPGLHDLNLAINPTYGVLGPGQYQKVNLTSCQLHADLSDLFERILIRPVRQQAFTAARGPDLGDRALVSG